MAEYLPPGVYIAETDAFPDAVVAIATAVPAFIGYTQTAARDAVDLLNTPTRVTSLAEYERWFGGPPAMQFGLTASSSGELSVAADERTRFLLYYGMRMFFANGGGPCWIVSVGDYGTADDPAPKAATDFANVWERLAREQEPTMVVVPDAVLLPRSDYITVSNAALAHCARMRNRVAILDVYDGHLSRTRAEDDVVSGNGGFRSVIHSDALSYGIAYYPWLNTSVVDSASISFACLVPASRAVLRDAVAAAMSVARAAQAPVSVLLAALTAVGLDTDTEAATHRGLLSISAVYRDAVDKMLRSASVMPPGAAIAGVIARTDKESGVFKAPANTTVMSATSPTVTLSDADQQDLNAPVDGKAINAIRMFSGRGLLVWGARTLDGNSPEWRYVSVRRTLIMLEQSITLATRALAFETNDTGTWRTAKGMIEHFLHSQWRAGALAGPTPDAAFYVHIGLGSTMTASDIRDGYMRVVVGVALVRPAEFIVITIQQRMQAS